LGTWSKIIHHCISRCRAGRLTLLKVDTTPALQHLPSKVKKIEYCDEYEGETYRCNGVSACGDFSPSSSASLATACRPHKS
jgi:hypothetical protein